MIDIDTPAPYVTSIVFFLQGPRSVFSSINLYFLFFLFNETKHMVCYNYHYRITPIQRKQFLYKIPVSNLVKHHVTIYMVQKYLSCMN